jgi:hypothetical protein
MLNDWLSTISPAKSRRRRALSSQSATPESLCFQGKLTRVAADAREGLLLQVVLKYGLEAQPKTLAPRIS